MITPRKKLDDQVEAIAAKYGLTVQQAVHEGRRAKRMIVRKEIYRAAIAHYNGNLTAAARYLGKDRATLHSAIKRGLLT